MLIDDVFPFPPVLQDNCDSFKGHARLLVPTLVLISLMSSCTSGGRHEVTPQVPIRELKFDKIRGPTESGAVLDVGRKGAFDEYCVTCPSVVFDGALML